MMDFLGGIRILNLSAISEFENIFNLSQLEEFRLSVAKDVEDLEPFLMKLAVHLPQLRVIDICKYDISLRSLISN